MKKNFTMIRFAKAKKKAKNLSVCDYILRHSEILAKIKSTENQLISVLCGVLPFLIVTPERLELSTQ